MIRNRLIDSFGEIAVLRKDVRERSFLARNPSFEGEYSPLERKPLS